MVWGIYYDDFILGFGVGYFDLFSDALWPRMVDAKAARGRSTFQAYEAAGTMTCQNLFPDQRQGAGSAPSPKVQMNEIFQQIARQLADHCACTFLEEPFEGWLKRFANCGSAHIGGL
jgi:hypothetical protein